VNNGSFLTKPRSFRSQLFVVLGMLVIFVLLIVEVSNGLVFYELVEQHREIQMDEFRRSITQQVHMQDRAFTIVDAQADRTLRNIMTEFQREYLQAQGNPNDIDLTKLKSAFSSDIDFFIIDSENVIRYSTFPPDIGLDFNQFPLMKPYIEKVWNTDEVVSSRASAGVNGGVKKFIYQRTPDQRYILEVGMAFYVDSHFAKFDVSQWKGELSSDTDLIASVNMYNYNGTSFSSRTKPLTNVPQRKAFEKAIETGQRQSFKSGDFIYEYIVVSKPESHEAPFAGLVAELVYDNAQWKKIWVKQLAFQGFIGFFAILFCYYVCRNLAKRVALPINQISGHVKRIADGNLNEPVVVEAGAEIQELAENIDIMRKRISQNKTNLVASYESSMRAMLTALEFREKSTAFHSLGVNIIAIEIANEMKLPEDELRDLSWGTMLHDLGKLAIPDSILLKPGPLEQHEFELIREHPKIGAEILRNVKYFENVINIVLCHHERYDGDGYPRRLKGEEIPLLARICAVADAFQAMIDDRPYRKGMTIEAAVAEIIKGAGTQFDPKVVSAFLKVDASALASLMSEIEAANY